MTWKIRFIDESMSGCWFYAEGGEKMDGQIKVSCIMPTHNRSELLIRALDSLLSQSLREIEIIVVDDASTDHTPDVLAQRMQIDQRAVYLDNKKSDEWKGRSVLSRIIK